VTAISNVGPSLGLLESGNVYNLPVAAKWYVAFYKSPEGDFRRVVSKEI